MIKNNLRKIICLSSTFIFVFCGCWNYTDINRRAIDLSIGIDEIGDEIEYTGEIAKLNERSGKAQITDSYEYIALGKYFEGARVSHDARITEQDFPGAVRCVVFSKKYAEKNRIEDYVNRLYYVPEFRNSVLLAISKEPTKEFFSHKIENDLAIGFAVEDTISTVDKSGLGISKSLQQVKADIEFKDIGYVLPYINNKNSTIEYLGLAIMKDSKVIDIIDRESSNGFLFLLSKNPVTTRSIPYQKEKNNYIATKTSLKKRKIKTNYNNDKVNIYIDLKLKTQILYLYKYESLSEEDLRKLETIISDSIREEILQALELSKNQFKVDLFGFARYFKADNPDIYKKINWKKEYSNVNFHINVINKIVNTNLIDIKEKK